VVLNIVDNVGVVREGAGRVQNVLADLEGLEVPQANSHVLASRGQGALNVGIPAQTEALLLVAMKLDLGVDLAVGRVAVLGAIKDENPGVGGQCCDEVGVLRAVARLVHLLGVVDLLNNVPLHGSLVNLAVAANLASLVIVVAGVGLDRLGDLDLGDLQVVLLALGGVGANERTVDAAVLALGLLDIGEPLDGQGWPGESRAVGSSVSSGKGGGGWLSVVGQQAAYLRIMS
jgi:hypothetical protein